MSGARQPQQDADFQSSALRYRQVREATEALCAPLATEDFCVQTIPEVSPPKWHLAHTSWFFETFVLGAFQPNYRAFHPTFDYLFNSYYETVGSPFPRPQRGLLSRPTVEEVYAYRRYVDAAMGELLENPPSGCAEAVACRTVLGLHHEQQHQELLLTDIKHNFGFNPLRPAYGEARARPAGVCAPAQWAERPGGVYRMGHEGNGFAFDNETPRHRVLVQDHALMDRLVTNAEFLEFIEAGGYRRPELWLADGWATVRRTGWQAPLYWEQQDGEWLHLTLGGMQPLEEHAPVAHVSFYEADAFARWKDARLPTEAELELAAESRPMTGNFVESGYLHPVADTEGGDGIRQLFGDVWEWTATPYTPYPGFRPLSGSLGEYNGKFMSNQMVLRGGSCATPQDHMRLTYRNFFYPHDRWQFAGIRLVQDR